VHVLAVLVVYAISYVQRHLSLLRAVSSVGVEWDRSVFDYDA
jgi:hypothetical protein